MGEVEEENKKDEFLALDSHKIESCVNSRPDQQLRLVGLSKHSIFPVLPASRLFHFHCLILTQRLGKT